MKKAVCIGINDYPGYYNDLYGCVNDAKNWAELLEGLGFSVEIILDNDATKDNVLYLLKDLVEASFPEDILVFTYSGHGTQIIDFSGDELDGYDEALYVYDGAISDDKIKECLEKLNHKCVFVAIIDSCFSGTVTRVLSKNGNPKFLLTETRIRKTPVKKLFKSEEGMKEILLSGCSDTEYSYDAFIDGKECGAFSYYALKVINEDIYRTYDEFYDRLREYLPNGDYPQTPQLEANTENRQLKLFIEREFSEPQPDPEPEPQPDPEPEEPPVEELPDTDDLIQMLYSILESIYKWIISWFK